MKIFMRSLIICVIISLLVLIFFTLAGCKSLSGKGGAPAAPKADEYIVMNQYAPEQQELLEALIGTIQQEMQIKKITGLSLAVSNSQGVIWSEGFGSANKKTGEPFTGDTISNVGSVSKLYTAAAIMRLVEMDVLELDALVSTYIPEFKPLGIDDFGNRITVRMLLNHESGLESDAFHNFFLGYDTPADFPYSYRNAIDAINKSGIVRKPYTMFSYSNLGFSLLGIIIERAMAMSFQDAVKTLIFDPLSMEDSSFNKTDAPSGRLATGYLGGKPQTVPYIRDMPAGSLNSTAKDMGLFLHSMLASYTADAGLLQKETVREMFSPSNTKVSSDLDFEVGVTWWIVSLKELPGEFVVGHGGDLPPYHALVLMLPERDMSVCVMVNSVEGVGSFSLSTIATEAARTFSALEGVQMPPDAREDNPAVPIPARVKNELMGYYASTVGLSEIKAAGNKLKIYTFNKWFDLVYHEDGTLSLSYKLLGIIPIHLPVFEEISISREPMNGVPSINLRIKGILMSPSVMIEPTPIDPAWLGRTGTYAALQRESMPQYTEFKLAEDEDSGFLCLFVKSGKEWSKFPLETVDAESAVMMGIGRGLGGKVYVTQEATGEVLHFQNFELQKQ